MTGFIFWTIFCALLLIPGVWALNSEKPVRFWNTQREIEVSDIKKYNRAAACLWFVFAIVMVPIGLPILKGQNSPYIVITVLGTVWACIVLMVGYMRIEKKYRVR